MELLQAIKQELDLDLEGRIRPEDYQALMADLFRCVRGEGMQAYLRGLRDSQKGGEQK